MSYLITLFSLDSAGIIVVFGFVLHVESSEFVFDRLAELGQRAQQFEREWRVGHVVGFIDVDVGGAGIKDAYSGQRHIGRLAKLPCACAVLSADRVFNGGARGAGLGVIDVGYDLLATPRDACPTCAFQDTGVTGFS